jgi:prepilin peptidase CpaA
MNVTEGINALAIATASLGAVTDHRTGHIPNWLTLGSLAAAPLIWFGAVASSQGTTAGLTALGTSLAGAFVCALGPAILFWRGGVGGGDVKLLAALGAILGPRIGINAEFYGFVLAALYVPGRLAWEGKLLRVTWGALRSFLSPFVPAKSRTEPPPELSRRMRLGPAILVGTVIAFVMSHGRFA